MAKEKNLENTKQKRKVTIYTLPTCPWCKKTKEFLKAHKINFTNKDVSIDENAVREMVKKSDQKGVPVIDINGQIILGFNEEKLREVLEV